ncbi:hypothetical protein SBA4_3550016 [Candidatus Sulfopaludibacter sp. SbA4]|nr:hypothetical protein SBA4_3550016 [Candidatus Sulfopaludibacter sp. SbA4]
MRMVRAFRSTDTDRLGPCNGTHSVAVNGQGETRQIGIARGRRLCSGHFDAIASAILGTVQGQVGVADEAVGIRNARPAAPGSTDTAGDGHRVGAGSEWTGGEGLADALRLEAGSFALAARQQDEKLFAPVASDGVVAADGGFHAARGFAENRIAGEMAVGIVDVFEPVEIDHEQRDGLGFAVGAGQFVLQRLEDGGAVEKAGQAVVGGLFAEGLAGHQQFLLQIENAAAGPQAHAQLVGVEGLGQVVIGPGIHPFHDVLGLGAGGQQEDVDVRFAVGGADTAANFDAIHAGHHPIENGEAGRVRRLQDLPGLHAVTGHHGLVSPLRQHGAQHRLKDGIILGGEDSLGSAARLGTGPQGGSRSRLCDVWAHVLL